MRHEYRKNAPEDIPAIIFYFPRQDYIEFERTFRNSVKQWNCVDRKLHDTGIENFVLSPFSDIQVIFAQDKLNDGSC